MKRSWAFAAACAVGALAFAPRQAALDDLARRALARVDGEIQIPQTSGLRADVRVVRDEWGIPHITAASPDDLFFAQGYVVAQDRLWQMEIWRRTAEGRLAEISGPQAVPGDRLARLLKYRGPSDDRELTPYHPDARRLMTAFVSGVNTFIAQHRERLPIEFVLTGIVPEPWTIETLTLRQTTFGDATNELQLARSVAALGAAEANRRRNPDPWDELTVPTGLDVSAITSDVLAATRTGARIPPPDLLPAYRPLAGARVRDVPRDDIVEPGSNNWVVSGALSATGKPVVVNDPHREVTLPSLRYISHLSAPGWNVIGASEPPFLGVAIGHNDFVAWGLTIVGTDQHDVYVEEVNPGNRDEVRFGKAWEPLHVVREEIRVKGAAPVQVELKFSRHGPIFFEDPTRRRAYALRSALREPGTAPYLAGLRLSQAKSCREFLAAAAFWNAPSENLICGDVQGNIAWRASALTPNRKGWTGRLPVPGHGELEWQGFRSDLPSEFNPESGLIVTANHNIQPKSVLSAADVQERGHAIRAHHAAAAAPRARTQVLARGSPADAERRVLAPRRRRYAALSRMDVAGTGGRAGARAAGRMGRGLRARQHRGRAVRGVAGGSGRPRTGRGTSRGSPRAGVDAGHRLVPMAMGTHARTRLPPSARRCIRSG